ncbi:MAG: c-type cytochrome, partial [Acidobacteria bacterium]|nr:c-type cytochrome [Acidobacteriota bacterium]
AAVVAYILTLSGGESQPSTPAPAAPAPENKPAAKPSDPNAGDSEAGRALFFDAANEKRCAACHQFQARGAEVGPDLTAAGSRPAREILRDILEPDARLSIEPVTITTKSGQRITGIKKQETRELIRVYDTATLPPVLRTLYKDQIESVAVEKHSPMPADYGTVFNRKQLLDLVSFLKSIPVSPEEVK